MLPLVAADFRAFDAIEMLISLLDAASTLSDAVGQVTPHAVTSARYCYAFRYITDYYAPPAFITPMLSLLYTTTGHTPMPLILFDAIIAEPPRLSLRLRWLTPLPPRRRCRLMPQRVITGAMLADYADIFDARFFRQLMALPLFSPPLIDSLLCALPLFARCL